MSEVVAFYRTSRRQEASCLLFWPLLTTPSAALWSPVYRSGLVGAVRPPESAASRRAMHIAPIFVRVRAATGFFFGTEGPFAERNPTILGAICIERSDGVVGRKAPEPLRGSDLETRAAVGVVKRGTQESELASRRPLVDHPAPPAVLLI